jgi:hypothetical protein
MKTTVPLSNAFDLSRTLDELEGRDWSKPTYDSYLVTTCHALRRKPLRDFTIEDLRIMIGQGISLAYLLPLAVQKLSENPLSRGDYYAGDLLVAVLSSDVKTQGDWRGFASKITEIADRALKVLARDTRSASEAIRRDIRLGTQRLVALKAEKS